ncbi:alpha/beta hydrolase [Streptomyces rugosispiralis]|uniref:Alpha/beta hydrolase family protein n=1 Tax=Streptomyces rugosispiralis TaxID=2967341 RepID=A0ABT1VB31_9ACTN|nr:alpha/beta hydrolase [Streptomyces rugosispiralis]MCQ8194600.1 alpha/beta hydrolase family protein [Streptomyces rugosispiralis]
MDYATLKSLKPTEFEDAAGGYKTVGDMASQAKDDVENRIIAGMRKAAKGQDVLEGYAADAAVVQLRKLATNFHYTQVECALITTALNSLAYELRAAKDKLDAAVEDAEAEKFTVGSDGSVSYPAAGDKVDGKVPEGGTVTGSAKGKPTNQPIDPTGDANDAADALDRQAANIHPNPNFGRAVAIANRIAQAVYDATQADEKWAPKLRKLKADDDLTVAAEDWIDAKKDTGGVRSGAKEYLNEIKPPPKDGDPKSNADWWKGLSAQEKADYASMYPDSIGKLNGLPADVRDEANRAVFEEKRAEYQTQYKSIPEEPKPKYVPGGRTMRYSDEWLEWHQKYEGKREHLKSALEGMKAIQRRFDRTGEDGLPEAYLLGFDPNDDGRVVLANGNPDAADHTALYVPGTKTHLGSIDGDLNRGVTLWRESQALSPGDKISTITWFDYDAPNQIPNATSDKYAEKAAPALREFLDGNKAAHEAATGSTAHTTVIGHSYGSTVIGDAAKYRSDYADTWSDPLPADDVIAAGSPGMQAEHAADLGIDPDHMWAMKAGGTGSDDWFVREGGRRVGLGGNGVIPTDREFGGHIMESDSGDHGGYWNVDDHQKPSVSLKNQARVIVGDYKGVTLE